MPGYLFHFCAEWQKARRVLHLDGEAIAELRSAILDDEGELDVTCKLVRRLGLVGWRMDMEDAGMMAHHDLLLDASEMSLGRSTTTPFSGNKTWAPTTSYQVGRTKTSSALDGPTSPQSNLSFSRTMTTMSTVRGTEFRSLDSFRREPIHFYNPSHSLANIPAELSRDDFVQEVRKRLSTTRLFPGSAHPPDSTREVLLSVEDAEDLFEALLLLQTCGGDRELKMGKQLDGVVDRFFALSRLRNLMERGASSLASFFDTLDLDKNSVLESCEVRKFMRKTGIDALGTLSTALAKEGVDVDKLAETLYSALDFNKDAKVELWEMRRQMSLAAPPRMYLVEMIAHQEMKNGIGKCGFGNNLMDRSKLFDHLCRKENLDFSPEDAVRYFRLVAGGSNARMLSPSDCDNFLKVLPQEVSWGVEPHAADRLYAAIGTRVLQGERSRQRDASLPAEALLHGEEMPDEAELRSRFDRLWDRCVGTSGAGSGNGGRQLRDSCCRRYLEFAQHFWQAREQSLRAQAQQKNRPKSPQPQSPRPESPKQFKPATLPRSLFPNIGDVLATASANLNAGQACVVRYRLTGQASFWGQFHTVLKNDHQLCPWPATGKVLGDTPFIGLVPAGLTWHSGGGGGFYLRGQAFTRVDANLRADIPKDVVSGAPFLFGHVEITPPSLVRTTRTSKGASGLAEEFELRLFCSTKHKIIGCVGEPLPVQVIHQVRPPPLATVQARIEGRSVTLRWGSLDEGPLARRTGVNTVRLYMRSLGGERAQSERTFSLEADADEWDLHDLAPDTEYEFRVRLENLAGPGREAVTTCRTNAHCTAPSMLACAVSGTSSVELRWSPPKVLGNESTRDRFQLRKETIECYEASLRVESEDKDSGAEVDIDGIADDFLKLAPAAVASTSRQCRWQAGNWKEVANGDVIASLGGLRPDTRYALEGLCALNSMGKGGASKNLIFWTVPQTPRIVNVRIKSGLVLVALSQTGGISVKDYAVSVALSTRQSEKASFDLPQSNLRGDYDGHGSVPELSLPFEAMPVAESSETHLLELRASNSGGWSEWSQVFHASAIARQQGAEQAQAALIKAIEARRIDKLQRLLHEVRDIEFSDGGSVVEEATALLQKLQAAKADLMAAMQARDPGPLLKTLNVAREVQLPDLGKAEALLRKLDAVVLKLETAKGIDALRLALKAAHEARLPPRLLTEAVERLGTREAVQQGLLEAMEAARVPGLLAVLETASNMHLPSEADAQRLLAALQRSESLLHQALEAALICDLEFALKDASESGLREDELIGECSDLLETLHEKQKAAEQRLREAMEVRHPALLHQALANGLQAQVPEADLRGGKELLAHLEYLLARVEAAEGIAQRQASLSAAREAQVPPPLLEAAELQLKRLRELHVALDRGDVEVLRRALKVAEQTGVKTVETAEATLTYGEWSRAELEVEISVSLARTERLRKAIAAALEIGIAEDQMESATLTLRALERRDLAAKKLRDAMGARKLEMLQKTLKAACDADVQEPGLTEDAVNLAEHLSMLRAQLNSAVERPELKLVYDAVVKASMPPALPDKELEPGKRILKDLQKQEYEDISIELRQAKFAKNFRLLDYIAARAKRASKCGVTVEGVHTAEHLARVAAEDGRGQLESSVVEERTRREYNRWIEEVPQCDDVINLPSAMVIGDLDIHFGPAGELLDILPREIVEGTLVVALEETKFDNKNIVDMEATDQISDKLLTALTNLLDPNDSVNRLAERVFDDHGTLHSRSSVEIEDGRLELNFAVYVRALHTGLEIAEVLCERGCVGGDIWDSGASEEVEVEGCQITSLAKSLSCHIARSTLGGPRLLSRNNKKGRLSDFVQNVRSRVLRRVTVEMSWTYPKGLMDTLDATCIIFDQDQLLEIVDHRGMHGSRYGAGPTAGKGQNGPDATRGSVRHAGDVIEDMTRSGKQVMQIRLDLIPKRATDLFFVLSAYNCRNLAKFASLRAKIIDTDTLREFASIEVPKAGSAEAVIMCCLYRLTDGLWRVNSFSVPCRGTARDYVPIMAKLLELGYPRNVSMRNQVEPVFKGMQMELKLDRPVKTVGVSLDASSDMSLSYAIENFGHSTGRGHDPLGISMARKIGMEGFKQVLVQALRNSGGDRFTPNKIVVHPPSTKTLCNVRVELEWRYPTNGKRQSAVNQTDFPPEEENFLDASCFVFEGQGLREIIDYQGPHGVRLVHNGVVNYSGLWVGKVGIGDATGGSVVHSAQELNNADRIGKSIFQVRLDNLPSRATELYFTLSAPTNSDVTKYSDVKLRFVDGDNTGHEMATVKWSKPVGEISDTEAVVMCCMAVGSSPTSGWTIDSFGCLTQGTSRDYRSMILCLRAIQEQRHSLPPQWPHQVFLSMQTREDREKQDKQALMLPRLPQSVLRRVKDNESPTSSQGPSIFSGGDLISEISPDETADVANAEAATASYVVQRRSSLNRKSGNDSIALRPISSR